MRCARVQTMEVSESIGGMEVCSGFPRVFANAIALPLDEVVELVTHDPAIEHSFDFKFLVIADDLGQRGRRRATTGKGVRRCEGELDDGENGMKVAHGEGEFELVGSMADTRSDFEGSETSMGEFRRRSGGANIARV